MAASGIGARLALSQFWPLSLCTGDILMNIFRGIVSLASATAMSHAIYLAISPVLTRLYGPEEFGEYTVYMSFMNIASIIWCFRYEIMLPTVRDKSSSISMMIIFLLIGFVVSLFSIFLFKSIYRHESYGYMNLGGIILFILMFSAGLYRILYYFVVGSGKFRLLSLSRVAQGVSMAMGQILAFPLPLGLVVGVIIGNTVASFVIINKTGLLSRRRRKYLSLLSFKKGLGVLRGMREYPLLSSIGALANGVASNMPALMITSAFGVDVGGYFGLAYRIGGGPFALVGRTVADVLFGASARSSTITEVRRATLYCHYGLVLIGIFPLVIGLLWGEELFGWIFGDIWRNAGHMYGILSIGWFGQLVASPLSLVYFSQGKYREYVVFQFMMAAIIISVFLTSKYIDDYNIVIIIYSVTMLVLYIGMLIRLFLIIGVNMKIYVTGWGEFIVRLYFWGRRLLRV